LQNTQPKIANVSNTQKNIVASQYCGINSHYMWLLKIGHFIPHVRAVGTCVPCILCCSVQPSPRLDVEEDVRKSIKPS